MICILCQCNTTKEIQFKDGKCYGKCLIPESLTIYANEYAVYTGNELEEDVDIEVREIILQEKSNKWVKKRVDNNCLAPDPNDCVVWCLENLPEKKETLKILLDTTQSSNYIVKRIEKKPASGKKNQTDWKEVLCEKDVTPSIIGEIQNALKVNQYYSGGISGKFDGMTKKALTNFQKNSKLPIGQLDLETLDALGVIVNI